MGVIVLGMHRSGTSAVTGALHALGLSVGVPAHLIAASEHNERGHWEVKDLVFLNEMILRELGGSWSAPPAAGREELLRLAATEWREGARELHSERLGGDGWVWKDPRLCLLVDFWRAVLDIAPVFVVLVRSPVEVARSLARRSGVETTYGVALWERYIRAALAGATGRPTWVLHYEDLVAEPKRSIEDLLGFLHDVDIALSEPDLEAAVRITTWTRPTRADPQPPAPLTSQQRVLTEALDETHGRWDDTASAALGRESPGLDELFRTSAPTIPPVLLRTDPH